MSVSHSDASVSGSDVNMLMSAWDKRSLAEWVIKAEKDTARWEEAADQQQARAESAEAANLRRGRALQRVIATLESVSKPWGPLPVAAINAALAQARDAFTEVPTSEMCTRCGGRIPQAMLPLATLCPDCSGVGAA